MDKKTKFRRIILDSGTEVLLGKNAESNDELMKKFKGKENTILHTIAPGSPFCVIDNLKPTKEELHLSGSVCARFSQDWRDNKGDVKMHVFTGKDISKSWFSKKGTWKIGNKNTKTIKVKKGDILKLKNL